MRRAAAARWSRTRSVDGVDIEGLRQVADALCRPSGRAWGLTDASGEPVAGAPAAEGYATARVEREGSHLATVHVAGRDEFGQAIVEALAGVAASCGPVREVARSSPTEEHYRYLLDSMGLGVFRATPGPDGIFLHANAAVAKMLGLGSPDEVTGLHPSDFYADPAERDRAIVSSVAADAPVRQEQRIVRRDGTRRWVAISFRPSTGSDGRVLWLDGMVVDATEEVERREQQALWMSGLQAVAEVTQQLLRAPDLDSLCRSAVELCRERLGVERCGLYLREGNTYRGTYGTDNRGRTVSERSCSFEVDRSPTKPVSPYEVWVREGEPLSYWDEELGAAVPMGQGWVGTTPVCGSEGALGMFFNDSAISGAPVDRSRQALIGAYCASLGSLIEYRRAQEEREALQTRVSHAQRLESLGVLAGGIAHDFNNILGAIMGNAEVAAMYTAPESQAAPCLDRILQASQRARGLVRQILTFTRQVPSLARPVSLAAIVGEAVGFLRSALPATVEIRSLVDPRCPAVLADPTQIHQVVMNLCTNAHQALGEHGGVVTVELESFEVSPPQATALGGIAAGDYARLTVTDTGEGMSEDVRRRIFDPFFTTKEQTKGTGLGLAVTHGIIAAHGGAVSVYSELGRGSTFQVYLPASPLPGELEPTEAPPPPRGAERVLLVDDEEPLLRAAEQMLASLGYSVTACAASPHALETLRASPEAFDVVVTDQTMPAMTGLELAAAVREVRPGLPVALLTGFSHHADADRAAAAGINAFLMKPYSLRQLAETVRTALDGCA